jgi:protein TonB
MKLPASYKRSGWSPSLLVSLGSHVILTLGASVVPTPAQYGVEAGLHSIAVVMTKETAPPKPLELPTEDAMALEATAPVEPTVSHEILRKTPQPQHAEEPHEGQIVSGHGATTEATPQALRNRPPTYPWLARMQGWAGTVVLRVLVTQDGAVGQIEIQQGSGHDILDAAALRAVHGWRFSPARIGSIHLVSWVSVPVRFQLIDGQDTARAADTEHMGGS